MSLFGISQFTKLLSTPGSQKETRQTSAEAFEAATQALGKHFDDMTGSVFQVADELQREMVDLMMDSFGTEGGDSRRMVSLPLDMMQHLIAGLSGIPDGQDKVPIWREYRNKLEVFGLVKGVASTLDLPADPPFPPLTESVAKAYQQEQYAPLWLIEGLGHFHGDSCWKESGGVPEGMLTDASLDELPAESLLMLHAGIGMAIAQHLLKKVDHASPRTLIRRQIEQFIELCRQNSRPGYEGAALESLGLIARNGAFYEETHPSKMICILGEELAAIDQQVAGYFWHGSGRATYFVPVNFLPIFGSIPHAIQMIQRDTPDEFARLHAMAGLGWGVTMVNIRHPEIVANLLKQVGDQLNLDDAFSNGMAAGIMMRADTTPDAPFIASYYQYQPDPADAELTQRWNNMVKEPCERAIQDHYPILKEHRRLGDIFRYGSLAELAASCKS
jgi:hypothetical protein